MLVGDEHSGKSSTWRQLRGGDRCTPVPRGSREEGQQETVGVEVHTWRDPLGLRKQQRQRRLSPARSSAKLRGSKKGGKDEAKAKERGAGEDEEEEEEEEEAEDSSPEAQLEFSVWDLAGQSLYRASHQATFSEHAIYVCCVDGSEPEEVAARKMLGWFDCIQDSVPGAVFRLLMTHTDAGKAAEAAGAQPVGEGGEPEWRHKFRALLRRLREHQARRRRTLEERRDARAATAAKAGGIRGIGGIGGSPHHQHVPADVGCGGGDSFAAAALSVSVSPPRSGGFALGGYGGGGGGGNAGSPRGGNAGGRAGGSPRPGSAGGSPRADDLDFGGGGGGGNAGATTTQHDRLEWLLDPSREPRLQDPDSEPWGVSNLSGEGVDALRHRLVYTALNRVLLPHMGEERPVGWMVVESLCRGLAERGRPFVRREELAQAAFEEAGVGAVELADALWFWHEVGMVVHYGGPAVAVASGGVPAGAYGGPAAAAPPLPPPPSPGGPAASASPILPGASALRTPTRPTLRAPGSGDGGSGGGGGGGGSSSGRRPPLAPSSTSSTGAAGGAGGSSLSDFVFTDPNWILTREYSTLVQQQQQQQQQQLLLLLLLLLLLPPACGPACALAPHIYITRWCPKPTEPAQICSARPHQSCIKTTGASLVGMWTKQL